MPSFTTTVEFSVYYSCGKGLCNQSTEEQDSFENISLTVQPCSNCMKEAEQKGHDESYEIEREEGGK